MLTPLYTNIKNFLNNFSFWSSLDFEAMVATHNPAYFMLIFHFVYYFCEQFLFCHAVIIATYKQSLVPQFIQGLVPEFVRFIDGMHGIGKTYNTFDIILKRWVLVYQVCTANSRSAPHGPPLKDKMGSINVCISCFTRIIVLYSVVNVLRWNINIWRRQRRDYR